MDVDQVLAFRLARSGLATRSAATLAEAAECPASDFARDAALLALAARTTEITRAAYDRAVDAGEVVVAYVLRGAIHAVAPADWAGYGRALIARDDAELGVQLGRQVQRLSAEHDIAVTDALDEVTAATADALAGGARLDKNALHEELRRRVRPELMPWCQGCGSHHVASMLWRWATIAAGARLDADRRYLLAATGDPPPASDVVRRYLRFYGPGTPTGLTSWAELAKPHARRLWDEVADELVETDVAGERAWILAEDAGALDSPPAAAGLRLLPPGDPYLQRPNRALLAPDDRLRARMFRAVGSPGAVLVDGRLAGLWRLRLKGRKAEVAVEPLGPLPPDDLEAEARRVATLRGADRLELTTG